MVFMKAFWEKLVIMLLTLATVDNNSLVSGKTKGTCNIVIKYNVVKKH